MLPCAICRAPRRKTHSKEFAVRFRAFAVRPWRTAKPLFPVVNPKAKYHSCGMDPLLLPPLVPK
jgi:hypothetical protein